MQTTRHLSDHFMPEHYDLSLDIDRLARTFLGTVTIRGQVIEAGSIYLHAKDLTIQDCHVNGSKVSFKSGENDELELTIDGIPATDYSVTVSFSGTITDQMHGMYPCYFKHDGQEKELIATQFESHHAREVFPCVDEPNAKASYDVTLTTETGITVLGNMPVKDQQVENSRLVTKFETTPKMSSYLLAWVYGELHSKSARTAAGVEVNVWATPAQSPESLDFALDIATRTVEFFDDYFGVPYPLPKCDHVALPDFSSGAMENWGLITYREVALLAQPGEVSVSSKHRIAAVIAHELSHQWFGNLVTMKWWNNLWLNESFANLMEYIALDAIEPTWNMWFDFAGYETVMSLRRDATDGVQAVQVDVNHPDEISTLFDPAIVYAKGSRLLRMLERHIGTEAFREGLRSYFKSHAYQNTTETDLWSALSSSSGKDIAALMTPWISQPGYPVVSVNSSGISQEQFFIGDHEPSDRLWPVPLRSSDSALPQVFNERALSCDVPRDTRLNTDDSAHFITHYSDEMLNDQLVLVTSGAIDPVGRLQLLHEQTLLARGQKIPSANLISLLAAYRGESAESVWDIMAVAFAELKKFVEGDDESEVALRVMARDIATPMFRKLGWDMKPGEPESDTKLRATILGLMIYAQDEQVLEHANTLAHSDISSLDPELRSLILGAAIKHASTSELFDSLMSLYRSTSSAELQQDVASGLTSTKDSAQVKRLITAMADNKFVRSQDVARWFVYLIRNRYSRDATWEWLQMNWQWIESTFGGDKSFDDFPRYAASGLSTRQQLEEYEAFFNPLKKHVSLTRVIEMGISEIKARVTLIEQQGAEVRSALINKE